MKNQIDENKKLADVSIGEFLEVIGHRKPKEEVVRGIKGLAKVLQSSMTTAQKIKNSGKIPYKQYGRVLLFKESDILQYKVNN